MKRPFKNSDPIDDRGHGPHGYDPPPPLENIYEDFKAVEKNLRRYVDYRFAFIAPLDGTFYRRHRVEIWSLLVILTLLSTTALEIWMAPRATNSSPSETTDDEIKTEDDAEKKNGSTKRSGAKQNPGWPDKQPPPGDSPNPSKLPAAELERWQKILKTPKGAWERRLKTANEAEKQLVLDYMQTIAAGIIGGDQRVSNRQKTNFGSWKKSFEEGKTVNYEYIRLGIFEYLLIRRQVAQDYALKNATVDLRVNPEEYPKALIDDYIKELHLEEAVGNRGMTDAGLQVAISMAELERGTRP